MPPSRDRLGNDGAGADLVEDDHQPIHIAVVEEEVRSRRGMVGEGRFVEALGLQHPVGRQVLDDPAG